MESVTSAGIWSKLMKPLSIVTAGVFVNIATMIISSRVKVAEYSDIMMIMLIAASAYIVVMKTATIAE